MHNGQPLYRTPQGHDTPLATIMALVADRQGQAMLGGFLWGRVLALACVPFLPLACQEVGENCPMGRCYAVSYASVQPVNRVKLCEIVLTPDGIRV